MIISFLVSSLNSNFNNKHLEKTLTNITTDNTYAIIDLEVPGGYYVDSVALSNGYVALPLLSNGKWIAFVIGVSGFSPAKNLNIEKVYVQYSKAN